MRIASMFIGLATQAVFTALLFSIGYQSGVIDQVAMAAAYFLFAALVAPKEKRAEKFVKEELEKFEAEKEKLEKAEHIKVAYRALKTEEEVRAEIEKLQGELAVANVQYNLVRAADIECDLLPCLNARLKHLQEDKIKKLEESTKKQAVEADKKADAFIESLPVHLRPPRTAEELVAEINRLRAEHPVAGIRRQCDIDVLIPLLQAQLEQVKKQNIDKAVLTGLQNTIKEIDKIKDTEDPIVEVFALTFPPPPCWKPHGNDRLCYRGKKSTCAKVFESNGYKWPNPYMVCIPVHEACYLMPLTPSAIPSLPKDAHLDCLDPVVDVYAFSVAPSPNWKPGWTDTPCYRGHKSTCAKTFEKVGLKFPSPYLVCVPVNNCWKWENPQPLVHSVIPHPLPWDAYLEKVTNPPIVQVPKTGDKEKDYAAIRKALNEQRQKEVIPNFAVEAAIDKTEQLRKKYLGKDASPQYYKAYCTSCNNLVWIGTWNQNKPDRCNYCGTSYGQNWDKVKVEEAT